MPKDEETYPIDSIVRIKCTGQFARIVDKTFLKDGKAFLNYLAEIEGREGQYALYHQDIEFECPPLENSDNFGDIK